MTYKEFEEKLLELLVKNPKLPDEIQNELKIIVEKNLKILNNFIKSKDFKKEEFFKLLDNYYSECFDLLSGYKNKKI